MGKGGEEGGLNGQLLISTRAVVPCFCLNSCLDLAAGIVQVLSHSAPEAIIDFEELNLTTAFASGSAGQVFRGT